MNNTIKVDVSVRIIGILKKIGAQIDLCPCLFINKNGGFYIELPKNIVGSVKEPNLAVVKDGKKWFFSIGKNHIKPAKILRVIYGVEKPHILADIVNKISAMLIVDDTNVVIFDNISEVYNMPHSERGTIGSSCMRGKGGYYKRIEEIFSPRVVAILDNGVLMARAILWENISTVDGRTIRLLDRVYSATATEEEVLLNWARQNNVWTKVRQSYLDSTIVSPDGKETLTWRDYFINIKNSLDVTYIVNGLCPYMDTMCLLDVDNLWLRPILNENNRYLNITHGYLLKDTGGSCSFVKPTLCDICRQPLDDVYYKAVDGNIFVVCSSCRHEEFVYSFYSNEYFPKSQCKLVKLITGEKIWVNLNDITYDQYEIEHFNMLTELDSYYYGDNVYEDTQFVVYIDWSNTCILQSDAITCPNCGTIYHKNENNCPCCEA